MVVTLKVVKVDQAQLGRLLPLYGGVPETTSIWAQLAGMTTLLFTHGVSNLYCHLGAQVGCPQKPHGVPLGSRSTRLELPAAQRWVPSASS